MDEENIDTPEEPKQKKPRKPRKSKVKIDGKAHTADEPDEEMGGDEAEYEGPQLGTQYVQQQGNKVTLAGKSIVLKGLASEAIKKWGITNVSGLIGAPCREPTVLTFKSAKHALAFYDFALNEDEDEDIIVTTPKVNWYCD